jgi:hypothetical protein
LFTLTFTPKEEFMTRSQTRTIILLLLFVFPVMTNAQGGHVRVIAHPAVERQAKQLQDNNQDTYRALADAIFSTPRIGLSMLETANGIGIGKIPASISGVVKDRLVYAEMQYRQGRGTPITEQQIVAFHNTLVEQLGLPVYARTNKAQVRYMRMHLLANNPVFMGYGITPNIKVGESISDNLSPLQAVHLTLEVMGQKLMNPDFQQVPEEWKAPTAPQPGTAPALVIHATSKFDEMRSIIVANAHNMTTVDALNLLDKGLDAFGIGR